MQRVLEENRHTDSAVQADQRFVAYKKRFRPRPADLTNKTKMLDNVRRGRQSTRVPTFLKSISDSLLRTAAEHSISEAVAMLEYVISRIKDELIIMLQEPRRIEYVLASFASIVRR
jgi:hypothetical protein